MGLRKPHFAMRIAGFAADRPARLNLASFGGPLSEPLLADLTMIRAAGIVANAQAMTRPGSASGRALRPRVGAAPWAPRQGSDPCRIRAGDVVHGASHDGAAIESRTPMVGARAWAGAAMAIPLLAFAVLAALLAGATTASAATSWQLTWADEFSASAGTRPDSARWGTTWEVAASATRERQFYTDRAQNASTDGAGNLAITARKETLPGSTCWYGTCQYTSARVLTKNTFTRSTDVSRPA